MDTISYDDYAENYYHGFLAGLLKNAGSYRILSNTRCAHSFGREPTAGSQPSLSVLPANRVPLFGQKGNKETGTGRSDLILTEKKFMGRALILELKVAEKFTNMETKCRAALEQIETGQYDKPLIEDGYRPILKYGICFFKKGCMVQKA